MQNFDLIHSPLDGINLIEASAGTGKTYTIAGIFLRLVLEKSISADKVLIVTFTRAATEELKLRVRKNLILARDGFESGKSDDPLIESLIKKFQDPDSAVLRIKDALIDFDKAAIFTIHGFCHKILNEFVFETQSLFDTELMTDPSDLIREVANDYWRRHFYGLPGEVINYFIEAKKITGPDYFANRFVHLMDPKAKRIPEIESPDLHLLGKYREVFKKLQKEWKIKKNQVISILNNSALNGKIYGSIKKNHSNMGKTNREVKVMTLVEDMDRFIKDGNYGFPIFKGFNKFTSSKLKSSTRKNFELPSNHIFDICDHLNQIAHELEAKMNGLLLYLELEFFKFSAKELQKKKRNHNIRFYDDLLQVLNEAIEREKKKKKNDLVQMIKSKFNAALIDEFQDTDSLQYKLFNDLFCSGKTIFFMIGDPKQSIYSFRGADVFSYIQASESAEYKSTLIQNYRSDPNLITAINTIFTNVKNPFVFNEIPFIEGTSSCQNEQKRTNADADRPLTLWYLKSPNKRPINKVDAVHLICQATSIEICKLISCQSTRAGDIAVLVRTNRQAKMMKKYLMKQLIPAVIYSAGNVFDSNEAEELSRILHAISEPTNERMLRSALVTDIFGFKAVEIDKMNQDSSQLDKKRVIFYQYFTIWKQDGFIRMFYFLIHNENVKKHILSLPDGERRLTNILHLTELLHRASIDKKLGMKGLLKWLSEQRHPDTPWKEEHILRLESDKSAVKIVTIHKSKGLEYSVVFCPFCWESSRIRNRGFVFHNVDDNKRLTLDLSHQPNPAHMRYAQNELLAENLRLLYVALTRAKSKLYLVWGRINTAETSALAYLFHNPEIENVAMQKEDIIHSISKHIKGLSDQDMMNDLKLLEDKSKRSIRLMLLPIHQNGTYLLDETGNTELKCKKFKGSIDHTWNVSSYSSLLSKPSITSALANMPDYAKEEYKQVSTRFNDSPYQNEIVSLPEQRNIFTFPRGIKAGLLFHDIFERIDFTDLNDPGNESLIYKKLNEYGFDESWIKTLLTLVHQLFNTKLFKGPEGFSLSQLSSKNRISEMEFYFPLNRITPKILSQVFSLEERNQSSQGFSLLLKKLDFLPTRGFMKGYIDLVFRHQDKYYFLDWKSNDLGPHIDYYKQDALLPVMKRNYYFLQYYIYTLALNQFLNMKDNHYHYKSHFGGIFYVFIRGIDSQKGPGYGIYYDLPDPELIDRLGQALISDY